MSKSNTLATASLVLSLVSLIGYSRIIEQSVYIVFVIVTGCVFVVGIISLSMGIIARRQNRRTNPVLVTSSIIVALGYLLSIGIVLCNIAVAWVIR